MRQVPDTWLFEPWLMPHTIQTHVGVFVGGNINSDTPSTLVQPVVDLAQATREAKRLLHSRRQTDEVKAAKKAVVEKHASRKNWGTRTGAAAGSTPTTRANSNTSTRNTSSRKATRASADNTQVAKAQLGFDF
jgi:deoxyribodipyrimidine photo-lyase